MKPVNPSIDPLLWHRLMELVSDALERPAGERQAFINDVAGNDAGLHARASALVASAANENSLLDKSPGKLVLEALEDHAPPSWVGRRIDVYRLLTSSPA